MKTRYVILASLLVFFLIIPAFVKAVSLNELEQFMGEAAGDEAGTSVSSAGDVNGDGYEDFLVGSPSSSAGAAYLIYGQSAALTGANLSTAIEFTGEAAGDKAGTSVSSAGDVNNDGYDDILVGATGNDDVALSSGAVYLIYGQASVLTSQNLYSAVQFSGTAFSDQAGNSVSSAGDVNGDGFDDFLIGVQGADSGVGAAYLIYGQAANLSSASLSTAVKFSGEAAGDFAGTSVSSARDVDNDSYDDILIGAQDNDDAGSGAGAAYLIYGQASALTSQNLSSAVQFSGQAAGDYAGTSVFGGDVNNDGYHDILVGASGNNGGGADSGAAYLIYGQANDLTSQNLSSAVKFTGESAANSAGYSVSSGDLNNDGYDDILVGAYGNNAAYLIYGQASALTSQNLSSAVPFTGEAANDNAGNSVSSADVNGDSHDDILVGAYGNDDGGNAAGAAYLGYLYIDNDRDGMAGSSGLFAGTDPNDNDHDNDGSETGTDCNDNDAAIQINQSYYIDSDNDGFGSTNTASLCSLTAPSGYSTNSTDCSDTDSTVNTNQTYYIDSDLDGYGSTTTASVCSATAPSGYSVNSTDCSDTDNTVNANQTYYQDLDGDGLGNPNVTTSVCSATPPNGYVTNGNDTDDAIKDVSIVTAGENGDITITYVNNETSTIDVFSYTGTDQITLKQYQDNYYLALHPKAKSLAFIEINALSVLSKKTLAKKNFPANSLKIFTLRNKKWAVVTAKNNNNKVKLSLVKILLTQEKLGKKVSISLTNKKIKPSKTKKNKNTILLRSKNNKIIAKYLLTKKLILKEI